MDIKGGIAAIRRRAAKTLIAQVNDIVSMAAGLRDENKALFTKREACHEVVKSLEEELGKAREKLSQVDHSIRRVRESGADLVLEADYLSDSLIKGLDSLEFAPLEPGPEILLDRLQDNVGWLRPEVFVPHPVPDVQTAVSPEAVDEVLRGDTPPPPPPEPVVATPEPEPSHADNAPEWLALLAADIRSRRTRVENGFSPTQLVGTWAIRKITNRGRSSNHIYVPRAQAADVVVAELRKCTTVVVDREDLREKTWRDRLASALQRAEESGLPVRELVFNNASKIPEHVKAYGAKSCWMYVPAKEPVEGTFPD